MPVKRKRLVMKKQRRACRPNRKMHPWRHLEPLLLLFAWMAVQASSTRPIECNEVAKALHAAARATAIGILRRRGSRNPFADADEAAQTWITKMLDGALDRFDFRHRLYPYAYKILKNICVDMGRRATRHHAVPLPVDLSGRSDEEPCRKAERNEIRGLVRRAVRTLPARKRQAVLAKYWLGYRSRHAARRLNIAVGSYNREMLEARQRVRTDLVRWSERCRPYGLRRSPRTSKTALERLNPNDRWA